MTTTTPDAFDLAYAGAQRRRRAWIGTMVAGAAACTALFSWLTSLPVLQNAAVVLACLCLPLVLLGLQVHWSSSGDRRAGWIAICAALAAWGLSLVALITPGLRWAYEDPLTGAEAMATIANDTARLDRTRDPEAEAIKTLIARAEAEPSPSSFRALVPYLDRLATNIRHDGEVREVSSIVREVLQSDRQLYLCSLHDEAAAMAALIPAGAAVPEVVQLRVAERLEQALKNLIHAHSEQRIEGSFDIPSVGINIKVAQMDEGGAPILTETGTPEVSNREIGITYPYAGHRGGDVVFADPNTVVELLETLRQDLAY